MPADQVEPADGAVILSATARTTHRRLREQGRTDRPDLFAVLRAGFVTHLGIISGGAPMVIPTSYGFDEATLYLHGSVASRSLQGGQAPVSVTITLADGLVLARSVFEHAVNYRSAMIYGVPRLVTDAGELPLVSTWGAAGARPCPVARHRGLAAHRGPGRHHSVLPVRRALPGRATPNLGRYVSPVSASGRSSPGRFCDIQASIRSHQP